MAIDLFAVAVAAYSATILLALIAEFSPWPRLARRSAISALGLALIGGAAWCTMVYQRGYIFSPGENVYFAKKNAGGGASHFAGGAGGGGGSKSVTRTARQASGELDIADEADAGDGGEAIGEVTADAEAAAPSNLESIVERLLPSRPRASRPERQRELAGDITRDCVGCPDMVIIGGGSALIGAPETDLRASISEKPQRSVRFWPGFALSRSAITAEEYNLFREAHARPLRICSGPAPEPRKYAVCLTASDAENYAAWLTLRTGKRFRLPTANEWEFAARTRGTTVLAAAGEAVVPAPLEGIGHGLAEMTADCFDPYVPGVGRERRVWETNPLLCMERILKGAGAGESPMHERFSARRPWLSEEPRWTIGFRVMRDLN